MRLPPVKRSITGEPLVPQLVCCLLICSVIFLAIANSWAGDYHRPGTMACSDCHVMHLTQNGDTPEQKLLKQNVTELCLSCHDGQVGSGDIAPDVMGPAGSGQATYRAAGWFSEAPGNTSANGHDLLTSETPPGGTTAMSLTCVTCHAPHGNDNYRNLVTNPGAKTGVAVTAVSQNSLSPTTSHYSTSNVHYTSTVDGLSTWCAGCHGDFHGSGGDSNMGGSSLGDSNGLSASPWLRHPTGGVTMSQAYSNQHVDGQRWFSSLTSRVPVVSSSGIVPGTPAGSDNEVFCGSCHRAHGSGHRYGLIWDNADTAEHEDETSQMDTCQQCHYK